MGTLTKPVFTSAKSILSRKSISHLGRRFMNFQDNSHHRWHSHCPSIQRTIYSMKDAEKCLDHCRELADFVSVLSSVHMHTHSIIGSIQFSSVAQSCPTLCGPMDCSMPGLPVHHQLPEFTQTHVHRVSDAIQPSHPLSSLSPPAPNPSQHQGLFQ